MTGHRSPALATALILGAVAQIVGSFLPQQFGMPPIGSKSAALPHPVTPAGYAFAIWSLIFLGSAALAIAYAWKGTAAKWIGWTFALALFVNTAWEVWVPAREIDGVSLLIIVTLLSLLLTVASQAPRRAQGAERWIAVPTVMIFAGWATAATFANIAAAFQFHDFNPAGHSLEQQAIWLIAVAALVAGGLAWRLAHPAYAGAVLWALVAIGVANGNAGPVAVTEWGAGLIVLAGTVAGMRRRA